LFVNNVIYIYKFFYSSVFLLYCANSIAALAQIVIIRITSQTTGTSAYGIISLYFLAYSILQVFETSLIRRTVDQLKKSKNILRVAVLFSGWSKLILTLSIPLVLVATFLMRNFTAGYAVVFIALISGVLDYLLGLPILRNTVAWCTSGRVKDAAVLTATQNISRFIALLILVLFHKTETWLIILIPLRRAFDWWALLLNGGSLKWPKLTSLKGTSEVIDAFSKYGLVSLALMVGTEGVGVEIASIYGQEVYGNYKAIFDLCSKLWFVTTLFPLVLYPKLKLNNSNSNSRDSALIFLRYSFLAYLGIVVLGILFMKYSLKFLFPGLNVSRYVFAAVLFGIALLGHSKFGMEVLQARTTGKTLLKTVLGFSIMVITIFLALTSISQTVAIIGAWISSSILLTICVDWQVLNLYEISKKRKTIILFNQLLLFITALFLSFMILQTY